MALPMLLGGAVVLVLMLGAVYGALRYTTGVPGRSHSGPLPPLTDEERALAVVLKQHVETIAAREHNIHRHEELEKAARYIEAALASYGYSIGRQEFVADHNPVRNIDVVIEPRADITDPEVIVVGAHYDSASGTPGANDNGSGAAAVIELARLLRDRAGSGTRRIRLVLFVNEEQPYSKTEDMGSLHYARALKQRNERVVAMYSLETIGYYSSEPGSQRYPAPFNLIFPDRGDFVAFVGTPLRAGAGLGDDPFLSLAHGVSVDRRRRPRQRAGDRLVGPLGLRAGWLPGHDGDRHRAVSLSALSSVYRHARQGRYGKPCACGQRDGASHPRRGALILLRVTSFPCPGRALRDPGPKGGRS
jgi:peptidase M28-like protein